MFIHKEKRRYTWISPDRTAKQIDYIIMSKKLKPTLKIADRTTLRRLDLTTK